MFVVCRALCVDVRCLLHAVCLLFVLVVDSVCGELVVVICCLFVACLSLFVHRCWLFVGCLVFVG